jgi:hypothetical protein
LMMKEGKADSIIGGTANNKKGTTRQRRAQSSTLLQTHIFSALSWGEGTQAFLYVSWRQQHFLE